MRTSSLDAQRFDVIVCGAGSAGIAAACGAARCGASTLLLERQGFCGGTPVTAMIHTWDAVKSCRDNSTRVVGGVASDLIREIGDLGGLVTADNPPEALTFNPELLKVAADRVLRRHDVRTLLHATVVDVAMEGGRVVGVQASLRDGTAHFSAPVTVDATGDLEIGFLAGAAHAQDGELQALTYHFRLGNVTGHSGWGQLEEACRRAMQAAYDEGKIERFGGPWLIRMAPGEISVNATRIHADPVDPEALTDAEIRGREDMIAVWNILRLAVPELRDSYIISGATQLHVRESRKLVGEYTLTEDDILAGAGFPDAIALGAWPVDIHPTDGFVGVHPHKENPPHPYEIPYRCLVPERVDGLLVAGRPISTTHRAHGSTRVPGTSLATGHAAGVAAALSSLTDVPPRGLDPVLLRDHLSAQGAILSPPSGLS